MITEVGRILSYTNIRDKKLRWHISDLWVDGIKAVANSENVPIKAV